MTVPKAAAVNEPPRIQFPCDYPIRVIGYRTVDFNARVLRIVREHAPDVVEADITVRDSREGGYCSLRLSFVATGEPQIRALHAALMAEPVVKLVL